MSGPTLNPRARTQPVPSDWGIQKTYLDSSKQEREAPPASVAAALEAMGARTAYPDELGIGEKMVFVRSGRTAPVEGPALLSTEDGGERSIGSELPADLPLGYHRLRGLNGEVRARVVVSPGCCPLPPRPTWGWAAQLYAVRSESSWGIGDLADLRDLARWSAEDLGAGMVVVNPLHAAVPALPQAASPYYPSSRRFRNPLYLRVEEVPGAAEVLGDELAKLSLQGRTLNHTKGDSTSHGQPLIDRDAVWKAKLGALERVWLGISRAPNAIAGFEQWCAAQGESLRCFAAFCVLVERHGRGWRNWPADCRRPDGAGVTELARSAPDRLGFHQWLQWLIDLQLVDASKPLAVVHDLAVGVDPEGADAWLWQHVFAPGMSVGAPSDEFNTQGQDWGVPPFDPWKLKAAGYGPFIETVRAGLAHAGGLRVDHVMGLFRLFWVPEGSSPRDGVYVRYPARDLLDILALESHRAGAFVVGEDLGTVEPGVREELARRQILSSRVLWSEKDTPARYPERAMASVTTHDLPTITGVWTGSDLEDQRKAGTDPNEEAATALRERVKNLLHLGGDELPGEVVERAYQELSCAPSLVLAASLDDALEVPRRPNMPGTTDSWPNWSIPLPVSLESLKAHPRPKRIAASLARSGGADTNDGVAR